MNHSVIKIFNVNARSKQPRAEAQANAWLAEHPEYKVVSFDSWEGFPKGCDDYHTKVELVLELR